MMVQLFGIGLAVGAPARLSRGAAAARSWRRAVERRMIVLILIVSWYMVVLEVGVWKESVGLFEVGGWIFKVEDEAIGRGADKDG